MYARAFFPPPMQHPCHCKNYANNRYLAKTMPESIWHTYCIEFQAYATNMPRIMAQLQLMQRICQVISSLLSLICQNIPDIGLLSFSPNHRNMLNDDKPFFLSSF